MSTTRAQEIRGRLNELAPYEEDGSVTAPQIAKLCAVTGTEAWSRMWEHTGPYAADADQAFAYFAAAHALLALAEVDPARAGECATQIRDAWDDGGGVGWWLHAHLGDDAEEVRRLTAELAPIQIAHERETRTGAPES